MTNRSKFRAFGIIAISLAGMLCAAPSPARETERVYLSGRGKDDAVRWDFFCTAGRNSGFWTNIAVPSNWELQGFGRYNYGHDKPKHSETGKYRRGFEVSSEWRGRRVFVVFEGVMTDTEVRVNGQLAGPPHQGGFYRFQYELTGLVNFGGTNLLEVNVSKVSANVSVEQAERQADYWVFGGIFRPVYLEAVPPSFIEWSAVDARADGRFRMDVHLADAPPGGRVKAQIRDAEGRPLGGEFAAAIAAEGPASVTVQSQLASVKAWSAETPNLYHVELTLEHEGRAVHRVTERFGFRTFEVRPGEGLFLNGQRIILQGANRHSFWPDSGRCLSRQICYDDVRLMKAMNMNAVRMSHYPPDKDFLAACDELGLYVLNELAGWQRPSYDTEVGKRLVRQLVIRDVNHPSILFWDNANEGGWNKELDAEFWLYDPQKRKVLHPWESNQGVNTAHYRTFAQHVTLLAGRPLAHKDHRYVTGDLYLPTEFLHGLYDGGHGAGLRDYWRAMRASPLGGGGFLWVLTDEGVVRTDQGGRIDCAGNLAPDGIVGPYREREGSFYTIKELWSPVQVLDEKLPARFDGTLQVENQYSFTRLDECRFRWQLADFRKPQDAEPGHLVRAHGELAGPLVPPSQRGALKLPLPRSWSDRDVLLLTALNPEGGELWTWSWPLKSPAQLAQAAAPGRSRHAVVVRETGGELELTAGQLRARFDHSTGRLLAAQTGAVPFPIANGPRLAPAPTNEPPAVVRHQRAGASHQIIAEQGALRWTWTVRPTGELELDCRYTLTGAFDYFGITFDCPMEQLQDKKWLGGGPYRVWKNRLNGGRTDVWHTPYNHPLPGEQWDYPEFPGYFRDLVWATFNTGAGRFTVSTETPELFLRVGTPHEGKDPQRTRFAFPDGGLSFLHGISPIGNKFSAAKDTGPEGEPNQASGEYRLKLKFTFTP